MSYENEYTVFLFVCGHSHRDRPEGESGDEERECATDIYGAAFPRLRCACVDSRRSGVGLVLHRYVCIPRSIYIGVYICIDFFEYQWIDLIARAWGGRG